MEICRLLNPTKKSVERVGKDRVEKSCPACNVKNHIRTTYCKNCNYKLRGPPNPAAGRISRSSAATRAAAARQRAAGCSMKAASANLAVAASAAAPPAYLWPRKKDKRCASGKIPADLLGSKKGASDFSRPRNFVSGFGARYAAKKTQSDKREALRMYYGHTDPRAVDSELYRYNDFSG